MGCDDELKYTSTWKFVTMEIYKCWENSFGYKVTGCSKVASLQTGPVCRGRDENNLFYYRSKIRLPGPRISIIGLSLMSG